MTAANTMLVSDAIVLGLVFGFGIVVGTWSEKADRRARCKEHEAKRNRHTRSHWA